MQGLSRVSEKLRSMMMCSMALCDHVPHDEMMVPTPVTGRQTNWLREGFPQSQQQGRGA